MKSALLLVAFGVLTGTPACGSEQEQNATSGKVAGGGSEHRSVKKDGRTAKAEELVDSLDPFYTQHVLVGGVPVVGSQKVSERALREVEHLIRKMLANRPDVLERLVQRKMYICVMAYNEMQTDLPECRHMSLWWAKRARGLGGRPVSCGEENLLDFPGDPYQGENIFIHEFAHGLHGAIGSLDEKFDARLRALYEKAKESGRFRGYGMNNHGEFWAEGVQSWFHCNRRGGLAAHGPDGEHICEIHTRKQLKEHLPGLAELLDEAFHHNEWVYVPVRQRLDQPHLHGFDPTKSPTFAWPAKVLEAYNRIEAEKAKQRKDR